MKILLLSHHNPFFRPKIFLKVPESIEDEELNQIPTLLELYDEGFFMHVFGGIKSANLIFEIPSKYGRGRIERLLVSVVIDSNSKFNLILTQELLLKFAEELKKIEEAYKAFYIDSRIYSGDDNKLKEIKDLLLNFFKIFPEENVIFERKDAKILIFGLSLAGKTTIIKSARKSIFKNTPPTISVDISRILVNNVSLLTYDTPGHIKFRDSWKSYLKGLDGLIFVLDVSERIKFPDARDLLYAVAKTPEMSDLPLLVLFNKVDLMEPDLEYLTKSMDLENLGVRPMKYFLTSAIKNINIDEAFNWLALELSERVFPKVKSDLGVIFSSWDENMGIKIIAVHPFDAFEDPDLIAVRCFSISQFVFGSEEFKRISVILPFPHLNSIAAIFFDHILNEKVRGGALPLCLIVYYNENVPRAIIDQFNAFIFEKLDKIKESYLNESHVQEILKEIHGTITNKLNSFKPTVDALKLAELRYQALFKAARDAIIIIDRKSGIIIDANEQTEKLLLMSLEDVIGMHCTQIKIDKENEDFRQQIFKQIQAESPHLFELKIKNSQDKSISVEISISEVQMGGQNLIQCILRDATEREQAEKKLRDSENKYRNLFEKSPFSIILINQKGKVVDCNPAMEQLLGYKREELTDKKFVDLSIIHQNHVLLLLNRFKDEKRNEIWPLLDLQLYKKDGQLIWARIQTSFVLIDNDSFFQIIAHDITEQKEIEDDIKNIVKFERIMSIISSRFVGIKDIDSAINDSIRDMGRLIGSTRVYLYLFIEEKEVMKLNYEWSEEGILPIKENYICIDVKKYPWLLKNLQERPFIHIKNVSDLPEDAKDTKYLMEDQNIQSLLIYPIQINDNIAGFLTFDKISKAVEGRHENFELIGIFSEILGTSLERKQAELALLESREKFHGEYDRANFYKELFVHDMHDVFKNIESTLDLYSKEDDLKKLINVKILMKNIRKQCCGGENLVFIIQKLTQLEDNKMPITQKEILKEIKQAIETVQMIYPEKKIEVKIESPSDKLFVLANDFLIDVFENILISSVKYTEKIIIQINIIVSQVLQEGKNYLKVEFIDNQMTISDVKKEKILTRGVEKSDKLRGLLLGFLLVERILDCINGCIWVEGGNKFIVLIPALR